MDQKSRQYIDILMKHQAAISLNKYDFRLAKKVTHRIHLKDNQPIFRKQFNLPEADTQFIEQSLDEWLQLGSKPYLKILHWGKLRSDLNTLAYNY